MRHFVPPMDIRRSFLFALLLESQDGRRVSLNRVWAMAPVDRLSRLMAVLEAGAASHTWDEGEPRDERAIEEAAIGALVLLLLRRDEARREAA